MSVTVYDGRYVAVDGLTTWGDIRRSFSKSRWDGGGRNKLLTYTGGVEEGLFLMDWYEKGADPATWPAFQDNEKRWTTLVVFGGGKHRDVIEYNQVCLPLAIGEPFFAWGAGREIALGALSHGASAQEAAEIVCRIKTDCGLPIYLYDLENPGEMEVFDG